MPSPTTLPQFPDVVSPPTREIPELTTLKWTEYGVILPHVHHIVASCMHLTKTSCLCLQMCPLNLQSIFTHVQWLVIGGSIRRWCDTFESSSYLLYHEGWIWSMCISLSLYYISCSLYLSLSLCLYLCFSLSHYSHYKQDKIVFVLDSWHQYANVVKSFTCIVSSDRLW